MDRHDEPVRTDAPSALTIHPGESANSKFTGSMFGLLGVNLATLFLTGLSLGLAYPWLLCWKQSWYAEHTYINGQQLHFDGTGLQLFGNWLKWLILTIITLGIYFLWLPIKIEQWTVKHTHFMGTTFIPEKEPFSFGDWFANMISSLAAFVSNLWDKAVSFFGKKGDHDKWVCPSCNCRNKNTSHFCMKCGARQPEAKKCKRCGVALSDTHRFCVNCGEPVNDDEAIIPPPKRCPRCGRELTGDRCRYCDRPKEKICPVCGRAYTGGSCPTCSKRVNRCVKCGTPIADHEKYCAACKDSMNPSTPKTGLKPPSGDEL